MGLPVSGSVSSAEIRVTTPVAESKVMSKNGSVKAQLSTPACASIPVSNERQSRQQMPHYSSLPSPKCASQAPSAYRDGMMSMDLLDRIAPTAQSGAMARGAPQRGGEETCIVSRPWRSSRSRRWPALLQAAAELRPAHSSRTSRPAPARIRTSWRRSRDRFRHQTRNVPHLPDVDITDFRGIHEHRYLPYSEDWPIARRYCGATADAFGRERPHDLVPDRGRHGFCRHRRQCRILRFRLRPLDGLQRTLPHSALNDSRL